MAVLDFTSGTLFYQQIRNARIAYVDAKASETAGRPLTDVQTAALAACYAFYHSFRVSPNLDASLARMLVTPIDWTGLIYPFQRILLVMAHASAVILMYKAGVLRGLFSRLEAVGQMAMTNYISQSIICTLVFFGYGLNWFAELEFYQLFYVVLAIWIMQVIVSPIWLRTFHFGPFEWLWRSLTYRRLQPFRRHAIVASPSAAAL